MSEYQYVAFRAIDGPVSKQNLAYMRKQSTRAEVTSWTFDNTYSYGDFHGNAEEMLRRGYDFHLHYADFGIRKLMIRLPHGFPDPAAARHYFDEYAVFETRDPHGPGTILTLEQSYEAGDHYDDSLYDTEPMIERLLPLRAELLDGDLRPLYIAYLSAMFDMNHDYTDCKSPPIPAGLGSLSRAQRALIKFAGIDDGLIAAAAVKSLPLDKHSTADPDYTGWLSKQSTTDKDRWLNAWMTDPTSQIRSKILSAYASEHPPKAWPTTKATRTLEQLKEDSESLEKVRAEERAEKAKKARAARLVKLANNTLETLEEATKLVEERSLDSYDRAVTMLVDLREALAGTKKAGLAEEHAQFLRKNYQTRKGLISELKKHGLIAAK